MAHDQFKKSLVPNPILSNNREFVEEEASISSVTAVKAPVKKTQQRRNNRYPIDKVPRGKKAIEEYLQKKEEELRARYSASSVVTADDREGRRPVSKELDPSRKQKPLPKPLAVTFSESNKKQRQSAEGLGRKRQDNYYQHPKREAEDFSDLEDDNRKQQQQQRKKPKPAKQWTPSNDHDDSYYNFEHSRDEYDEDDE